MKIINYMDRVFSNMQMEIAMKGILEITNSMAKAYFIFLMAIFTKVNLEIVNSMERGSLYIKAENGRGVSIRGISKIINIMGMELFDVLMGLRTKGSGGIINLLGNSQKKKFLAIYVVNKFQLPAGKFNNFQYDFNSLFH